MPRRESWPTDHGQCCVEGLYGGGLFPFLCNFPVLASNPGVSLSMKICAPRKAGRTKPLSSLSFLWLACIANVSARVNARKLETEPKKKHFCFLSLPLQVFAQLLERKRLLGGLSYGPLRFVTSHSRFALARVRKAKRRSRREAVPK